MAPLLVLRPEPGASQSLARAQALGMHARSVPLFEVVPLAWAAPDPGEFDAVLITSANALRHGGVLLALYCTLPVHAVGAATARAARDLGFAAVHAGSGDVAGLLAGLVPPLRLFHPCGLDRRHRAAPGITILSVPVYESRAVDVPAGLASALAEQPVIMVHSPRAAAHLAALVPDRSAHALAAISPAAARAAGDGWGRIAIATRPDDQALLAIAVGLCEEWDKTRETGPSHDH